MFFPCLSGIFRNQQPAVRSAGAVTPQDEEFVRVVRIYGQVADMDIVVVGIAVYHIPVFPAIGSIVEFGGNDAYYRAEIGSVQENRLPVRAVHVIAACFAYGCTHFHVRGKVMLGFERFAIDSVDPIGVGRRGGDEGEIYPVAVFYCLYVHDSAPYGTARHTVGIGEFKEEMPCLPCIVRHEKPWVIERIHRGGGSENPAFHRFVIDHVMETFGGGSRVLHKLGGTLAGECGKKDERK